MTESNLPKFLIVLLRPPAAATITLGALMIIIGSPWGACKGVTRRATIRVLYIGALIRIGLLGAFRPEL